MTDGDTLSEIDHECSQNTSQQVPASRALEASQTGSGMTLALIDFLETLTFVELLQIRQF